MNELERLIANSYGSQDYIFAGHPSDAEFAREALIEAATKKVGLSKFLDLHKKYLKNRGCSNEHIDEQLENVKDLGNYFDSD